jgi:hypothetical protein
MEDGGKLAGPEMIFGKRKASGSTVRAPRAAVAEEPKTGNRSETWCALWRPGFILRFIKKCAKLKNQKYYSLRMIISSTAVVQ